MGMVFSLYSQIGGYNVYFGTLHNHTSYSDGQGTPAQAYVAARNAGLDFFGLADHGYLLSSTEWNDIKSKADYYNNLYSDFTAFHGFEWTHSATYGHVAIINSSDYCNRNLSSTNTFSELVSWVHARECIAFFNHPGDYDGGNEFNHFNIVPSDKFVGIELFNKNNPFSEYFYNNGYNTSNSSNYWEEGLEKGWRIGASGSEDNHWASWGTYTDYRMAVLAESNTKSSLLEAMKKRRFYSTLDKNLEMSFNLCEGGWLVNEMGSIVPSGTYDPLVLAEDGNGETFSKVEFYKNGSVIRTNHYINASHIAAGDFNVTASPGDYFYVKVTQTDGDEAISSPITVGKTFSTLITSGANDAEETYGYVHTDDSQLELAYHVAGLRYNLNVPQGANILKAYIRFTSKVSTSGSCALTIWGHDIDNSPQFIESMYNISGRTKTSAQINWDVPAWTVLVGHPDKKTPDLKSIIQEIVDRPGFQQNNNISIMFSSGSTSVTPRAAYTYESSPSKSAQLVVVYDDENIRSAKSPQEFSVTSESGLNFRLHPNPVSNNMLTVTMDHYMPNVQMDLLSIDGKVLITEKVNEINYQVSTENLKPGFYFVRLSNGEEFKTSKLIIE